MTLWIISFYYHHVREMALFGIFFALKIAGGKKMKLKYILLGTVLLGVACFLPNPVEFFSPDEGEVFYAPLKVPLDVDIDCGIDWESCRRYLGEDDPTSPYYDYCFSPDSIYVTLEQGSRSARISTREFTVEVQESDGEVNGARLKANIDPLDFQGFTYGEMVLQFHVGLIPTVASPTGCSRLYDFEDEVGFEYLEWEPQPLP